MRKYVQKKMWKFKNHIHACYNVYRTRASLIGLALTKPNTDLAHVAKSYGPNTDQRVQK
jgi:hypothetical protein